MLQAVTSRTSVELFLSRRTEQPCRVTLLCCFRNFLVAKYFRIRRRAKYQDFPSKVFCLTVPEFFVGQIFRVSKFSCLEKFHASEGYATIFCRNFLSHSAEKLRRVTLLCCFRNFLVAKYFRIRRRAKYQDFPSKVFCLTVPEFFVGQTFRVSKFSCLEKFHASEGFVTIFCRNFLSHSVEKFRR